MIDYNSWDCFLAQYDTPCALTFVGIAIIKYVVPSAAIMGKFSALYLDTLEMLDSLNLPPHCDRPSKETCGIYFDNVSKILQLLNANKQYMGKC